jgi:hypothetical protein
VSKLSRWFLFQIYRSSYRPNSSCRASVLIVKHPPFGVVECHLQYHYSGEAWRLGMPGFFPCSQSIFCASSIDSCDAIVFLVIVLQRYHAAALSCYSVEDLVRRTFAGAHSAFHESVHLRRA